MNMLVKRNRALFGACEVECKCTMAQKLVGDGCDICNPELAEEYERLSDEEEQQELSEKKNE